MTDPIVDSIVHQFKRRSELGIDKYGTTLYANALDLKEWIEHTKQELMDAALYRDWEKSYRDWET